MSLLHSEIGLLFVKCVKHKREVKMYIVDFLFFAATIDFTSNSESDNFGGWKIGNDCNGEENSGPCYDMSASSTPSKQ